jgi:DNA gyrase subunit A
MGRVTQGVRLINLEKRNDEIASVCKVNAEDNGEENDAVNVEEYESGEDRDNVEAEMGSDVNTDENVH